MPEQPSTRAEQRASTRRRILDAAVLVFAEHGFAGASTRLIAARAEVTQGLTTYYFPSKDELWRAAADQAFDLLTSNLPPLDASDDLRELLRAYVHANAAHPEIFHFLVDAGRHDDDRMRWLVDTHIRPRYEQVRSATGATDEVAAASLFYAVVGAASFFFAVNPECRHLTGTDPSTVAAIDAHVALVLSVFTPT